MLLSIFSVFFFLLLLFSSILSYSRCSPACLVFILLSSSRTYLIPHPISDYFLLPPSPSPVLCERQYAKRMRPVDSEQKLGRATPESGGLTEDETVAAMTNGAVVNASGYKDQLKRQYGLLGLAGIALTVDNAWIALGSSISVSIGRLQHHHHHPPLALLSTKVPFSVLSVNPSRAPSTGLAGEVALAMTSTTRADIRR